MSKHQHTGNQDEKAELNELQQAFIISNAVLKQLAESLNLPPENHVSMLVKNNDEIIKKLK